MRTRSLAAGLLGALTLLAPLAAQAAPGGHPGPPDHPGHPGPGQHGKPGPLTLAVFGDAPYGTSNGDTAEFGATPAFIDTINADPDVSTVVHVGDIHSGSQYCTEAYDRSVAGLWQRFADPLVYTPGDNEWTDCHKKKEGGGAYNPATGQVDYVTNADGSYADHAKGDPVANLALVRSIFFPVPGTTLGSGSLRVISQAQVPDRAHPDDAQYVENVTWTANGVRFVTIDVPGGSNNDSDPWYGAPSESPAQAAERTARTAADLRWLDLAFAQAAHEHARGVVVMTQADMWDVDGKSAAHLTGYEPIVKSLADHTNALDRPVLLLNGDSHVYRSDNPFSATAPCLTESGTAEVPCDAATEAASHPGYDVPDFHRVVVHGSTAPLEWLKLTVSAEHGPRSTPPSGPDSFGPFSWTRVATGLGGSPTS